MSNYDCQQPCTTVDDMFTRTGEGERTEYDFNGDSDKPNVIHLGYYVPERLRNIYKPRLESVGLWFSSSESNDDDKRSAFQKVSKAKSKDAQAKQKAKSALERQKVLAPRYLVQLTF